MARKIKNPEWKEDLEFLLSKNASFTTACRLARVSQLTARRHGFKAKQRKFIHEHHDDIVQMRQDRLTAEEIAEKTGFSVGAINAYCQAVGIKKRKKGEPRS